MTPDKSIVIRAGDMIDLGEQGLIEFHSPVMAEARRMVLEEHQRRTRDVIEFVKRKHNIQG
jgi:hypothetical protein